MESLEDQARGVLPRAVYDYLAGGAGDERTLDDNVAAWARVRLRPRILCDVTEVSVATTVLGTSVRSPVLVAPVAFHRVAHPEGEVATARGAADGGSIMVVSTRASTTLEDIAEAAPGAALWFQVYVLRDREWTADLVARAAAAGYRALVLTGDTPFVGRRRRDAENGFVLPPGVGMANLPVGADLPVADPDDFPGAQQSPAVTFDDIGWLASISRMPVVVKGVLRGDDALRCIDSGASALVVSNHGGRQLDGAVAAADALPEVVGAVGDRVELYVDGGIRRGTDVGRPILWGLATAGAAGAQGVLELLSSELGQAMALAGARGVDELTPDLVVPSPTAPHR
ncbi:MAG: alpha-hydroxy-acid oxidizing protein [Actinobacteria bacterium]|nr:MAG: alpha-hydroxy-acid oxidizing protein [Actinomycetota bacterium]